MNHESYGFFPLPPLCGPWSRSEITNFWRKVDDTVEDLSRGVGVYIVCTRSRGRSTPWYVGKTCAVSGFRGEVFQPHKRDHYRAVAEACRHPAELCLLPRLTPRGDRLSSASKQAAREIDLLETRVISHALNVNPEVRNSHKTAYLRNCQVRGIFGTPVPGRRRQAVRELRAALGLR